MNSCRPMVLLLSAGFGTTLFWPAAASADQSVPPAVAGPVTRPAVAETSARARAAAAERVYKMLEEQDVIGGRSWTIEYFEVKIRWSRRWAEAVAEQANGVAERTAAAQSHLDRVQQMANRVRNRTDVEGGWLAVFDFFLADARLWLEQEKQAARPK